MTLEASTILTGTAVVFAASMLVGGYLSDVYATGVAPFAGALVALLVWVGVLYVRYSGGLKTAIPAALIAWGVSVGTLHLVAAYTAFPFQTIGIPGV